MLNIKNCSKTINNKKILDTVSLSIHRGEIAVLLGVSGVGKSTLLRALNNLESLDSGTIELEGKNISLNQNNHTHEIGMIFQHFNLFEHLTAKKNITIALEKVQKKTPREAEDIALALLEEYGLNEHANAMISELSGGQKQRLAIIRTLALKPKVLCMDEPTSALDPKLSHSIARTINKLADEGYIILLSTHDISLLENIPCTIHLMEKGTIIESAKSTIFFRDKTKFPRMQSFYNKN